MSKELTHPAISTAPSQPKLLLVWACIVSCLGYFSSVCLFFFPLSLSPIKPILHTATEGMFLKHRHSHTTSLSKLFTGAPVSDRGVQPVACRQYAAQPRMAMNVTQHKIRNLLKVFFCLSIFLVFVYLMCGPRQFFFFRCGLKMLKGWTPLKG